MIQSSVIQLSNLIELMTIFFKIWKGHPRDTKICNWSNGWVENQRRHHDNKYGINAWALNTQMVPLQKMPRAKD